MKRLPDVVWAPLSAGAATLAVGAAAVWAGLPWLVPSLGPTLFLQVHDPEQPSARPYHVLVGHAAGIVAGVLAVWITGAVSSPAVLSAEVLAWPRVWASALALGGTLLLHVPLRASHPPAAATALLLSLGGVKPHARELGTLAAGIVLVAILGEALRRMRVAQTAS